MKSLRLSKTKLRRIAKEILALCPDYMGYPHLSKSVFIQPRLSVSYTEDKYSGEFNRTELWKKLPRKVMWQTFLVILDYLVDLFFWYFSLI